MKNLFKLTILIIISFVIPKISFGQFIQWLGTKDNVVEIRNILRADSAIEFPLTDTSKHPTRPGRLISFNGLPYWYDGVRWSRLRGDTSTNPSQVNADWTATSGVAFILHKPVLAAVAISGSYTDLSNKPTIPAAQVNVDWNASSGITQVLNRPRMIDSIWKDLDSIRIRVRNNDNSFRTFAIKDSVGSTGGSGSVTLVSAGSLSPLFGSSVNNPNTTPAISFTLSNAGAHSFFGNNTGSTGPPAYVTLTVGDLPNSIPVSKTLLTTTVGTGITLSGNNLSLDTLSILASIYDVSLKQDKLNGTGYLKQNAGTTSYLTPTQVTADLNLFTTTLQGLVPAPGTSTGKVLSDNGTWIVAPGGGVTTASNDATGTAVGSNLPLTLATVNSNVFGSNTLLKHTVNAKGLITSAVVVNASDLTGILGYVPFQPSDTVSKLATKYDLTKLDTVKIIPSPLAGTAPIAMYGRNDTLFGKRIINGIQNNDSSITVGNVIAANNLNDLANKNSALNNILPSQSGNAGKILQTDGTNTSWVVQTGGSGTVNLTYTNGSTTGTITPSGGGTAAIIPAATHSIAGLITAASQSRIDSIVNIANTKVGDTIGFMTLTLDTIYLKGIDVTSTAGSMGVTKNHTQQKLSYNVDINPSHTNTFTAPQNFGQLVAAGNVFFSATNYQASNGKLDYIIQDTTTGKIFRTPYIPIDSTGAQNGYVLTWNTATGKATFVSPGVGGTVTNFSAGTLSPLFTTNVATSTTTPALTFTLTNAPANSVFGSVAGGAPSYFTPSLTSSLFSNQGTTSTLLHGNGAGNLTFGAVNLGSDVTSVLPTANGGVSAGGTIGQALIKNSSTNYDYSWANTINSIVGTVNQINVSTTAGVSTLSTPQNIHTGATPTFAAMTLASGDLALNRTDQALASITRPNTVGAKGIQFSVVGGGNLDNFNVVTANAQFYGNLTIIGQTAFGNRAQFAASTTTGASFNIPTGAFPVSPLQGDIGAIPGHLYYRDGGVTYDLLAASSASGITTLNGLTASVQTLVPGASGSDFGISSSGTVHTFNLPDAGSTSRGVINTGTQNIAGTKTFINAPILTTSSTTGQVWTATNNAGAGGWSNSQNIYNNDGTLTGNRTVTMSGNTLTFSGGNLLVPDHSITSGTLSLLNSTNGNGQIYFPSQSGGNGFRMGRSTGTNTNDFYIYDDVAAAFRLQIGTTGKVTVPNTLQVTDGTQGANKVFTSDGSGNGSWGLVLSSGSYTPTVSAGTNTTAASILSAYYTRVGNIVHVRVAGTMTTTSTNTVSNIFFSLPIATSNFSTSDKLGSAAIEMNAGGQGYSSGLVTTLDGSTATLTFRIDTSVGGGQKFCAEIDYTL